MKCVIFYCLLLDVATQKALAKGLNSTIKIKVFAIGDELYCENTHKFVIFVVFNALDIETYICLGILEKTRAS